jgi:hypothetical protein
MIYGTFIPFKHFAIRIEMQFLCHNTLCPVNCTAKLLEPDEKSMIIRRNVGNCLPVNTA